jgi:tRNA 2-selenouridine synthase SelU
MGACCESNRNQLIIDQIIAEDNIRRAKATRPAYMDSIYDEIKVKKIQNRFLCINQKSKFFKAFQKLQNFMVIELNYNLATNIVNNAGHPYVEDPETNKIYIT